MKDKNIMTFEDDDKFIEFAVSPNYKIFETEKGTLYYNITPTQEYLDAVEAGKQFYIEDENSSVRKRKCVSKGVCSFKVKNMLDEI